MSFVRNVPAFSILFVMFAAIISSVMSGKTARKISIGITAIVSLMSVWLLGDLRQSGDSFVYVMGHVGAPWGNELRAGMLEAGMALLLCLVMLFALLGGKEEAGRDLDPEKAHLYYIMADLLLAANLALVYTNDMFTAYVFIEISTLTACGMILGKQNDFTTAAGVRYMIMSLIGSGLTLLGICFLYDMTGHLLMSNMQEALSLTNPEGQFHVPLLLTVGLICVGLSIKSALWPFHSWLPGAYGYSTVTTQAALSSIVSKGYIFLLIKIIYRVLGFGNFVDSHVTDVLFVFGIVGMILGSLDAIRQNNIRKMIAYSSIAQIGYIYMGIGMANMTGTEAGIYHIFAHATAKSLVFLSAAGLIKVSAGKSGLRDLSGAGLRNKVAGFGFVIGALSMVGIPGLGGFVSKLLFAKAAFVSGIHTVPVLVALAVSTILNAIYFMRVVLWLYTPHGKEGAITAQGMAQVYTMPEEKVLEEVVIPDTELSGKNTLSYDLAILGLAAMNLFLGIAMGPMVDLVRSGLELMK